MRTRETGGRNLVIWAIGGFLIGFVGVVLAGCVPAPPSCSHTWIGPAGGAFDVPGNWDVGSVPTASSTACSSAGSSIVVNNAQAVLRFDAQGTVTLASGGQLRTDGNASFSHLDLSGGSLIGPGAPTVGAGTWAGGSISNTGTLTITGPVDVDGSTAVTAPIVE